MSGLDVNMARNEPTHRVTAEVETDQGKRTVRVTIDDEQFVKLFMDPIKETVMPDMQYLIGYKMVYVVDAYRQRIPGVIAIVTLKIEQHKNAIFQSEGSHNNKTVYEMINLSNKTGKNSYYTRNEQAQSLRKGGNGDMIAWEHSEKYCAHTVETLAITFCGKFKNIIQAAKLYDQNMVFAESAYTHEEKQTPVVYEVGKKNFSKHDRPSVSSGKCLDFFHFFLRPEYCIDYGFWQFS